MGDKNEVLGNLILELRRGTIILSVLSQLSDSQYGYSLVQSLEEKGVTVEANTLYPLLRRLEAQGLLENIKTNKEDNGRLGRILSDKRTPYLTSFYRWLVLDNLTLTDKKIWELENIFFGKWKALLMHPECCSF